MPTPPPLLVTNTNQIVSQCLDFTCSFSRLDALRVVRNKDGLLCFDAKDTFLALGPVDASIISLNAHVLVSGEMYAVAIEGTWVRVTLNNRLYLVGFGREIRRYCPNAISSGTEYSCLINLAGTNQACVDISC